MKFTLRRMAVALIVLAAGAVTFDVARAQLL